MSKEALLIILLCSIIGTAVVLLAMAPLNAREFVIGISGGGIYRCDHYEWRDADLYLSECGYTGVEYVIRHAANVTIEE